LSCGESNDGKTDECGLDKHSGELKRFVEWGEIPIARDISYGRWESLSKSSGSFERTFENLCSELRGIGEYLLLMGKEDGKYRNGKRRAAEGGRWKVVGAQSKYLI
jgi:hypothetical protein